MQPGKECKVNIPEGPTLAPGQTFEVPTLSGGGSSAGPGPARASNSPDLPLEVTVPTRHRLIGEITPLSSEAKESGFEIKATPVGPDAEDIYNIVAQNDLELKAESDHQGYYELPLPAGKYEVTARAPGDGNYVRTAGSDAIPAFEDTRTVEIEPVGFYEAQYTGSPEHQLNWESSAEAGITVYVKKYNLEGECRYAHYTYPNIKGYTPLGVVTDSGHTGVGVGYTNFDGRQFPPGEYTADATVTWKANPPTQYYEEDFRFIKGQDKSIWLGPDACLNN